jgi:hypothetical protein
MSLPILILIKSFDTYEKLPFLSFQNLCCQYQNDSTKKIHVRLGTTFPNMMVQIVLLAADGVNLYTRVIQKVRLQHLCRIEKCLYSIEIHRILHKYIKLFFNVIAVEIEIFLQSGHQLLYASVINLHRQLFQPLPRPPDCCKNVSHPKTPLV